MSERFTSVESDAAAFGLHGHVIAPVALYEAKAHWERQRQQAESALAAIQDGSVRVYHQNGIHVAHNRRLIFGRRGSQDKTQQP